MDEREPRRATRRKQYGAQNGRGQCEHIKEPQENRGVVHRIGAELNSENEEAHRCLVSHLDNPMYVLTVASDERRAGCLVGFATQCSIRPPRWYVGNLEAQPDIRHRGHSRSGSPPRAWGCQYRFGSAFR